MAIKHIGQKQGANEGEIEGERQNERVTERMNEEWEKDRKRQQNTGTHQSCSNRETFLINSDFGHGPEGWQQATVNVFFLKDKTKLSELFPQPSQRKTGA